MSLSRPALVLSTALLASAQRPPSRSCRRPRTPIPNTCSWPATEEPAVRVAQAVAARYRARAAAGARAVPPDLAAFPAPRVRTVPRAPSSLSVGRLAAIRSPTRASAKDCPDRQ